MNHVAQVSPAEGSGAPASSRAEQVAHKQALRRTWIVGLTSFCFSVLQSICALFLTISGVRTVIGLGALAASSLGAPVLAFHADAIRIPMLVVAIGGSAVNLYAVWRARRLRARPASAWRAVPLSSATLRAERLQIALAVLTLALVLVEWIAHLALHGGISLERILG